MAANGRTFCDKAGREWTVHIDGAVLAAARRDGLKLSELMMGVMPDIGVMLELTWHGVQHSARLATKRGRMTKDAFLSQMTGQVLRDALEACSAAIEECFAVDEPEDVEVEESDDATPLA